MNIFKDKKINIISFILSIFLSLIVIIGRNISRYMYNPNVYIFKEILKLKYLIIFIVLSTILFIALNLFFNISKKIDIRQYDNYKFNSKKIFIISFIIIFICYIPYFLDNYPAIMSSDSISQFEQIFHDASLSNSHPVVHTLFMGVIFNFGKLFFNSNAICIALISIVQMVIMSLLFSYIIKLLYEKKVNKYILIAILIYYAIYPVHGLYSVTMWKDVIFSVLFTIFSIYLYKLYEKEKINKIDIIKYILITILMLFFRNNAIYIFIFCVPFIILIFNKYRLKFLFINLSVIIFYYIITGPVYTYFNIIKTSDIESLAIPIQQVGRVVYKNEKLSSNDIKLINRVMDVNTLKNVYNPITVDNIKFNSSFNGSVISENKLEYFKLYLKLVKNYPSTTIEAYLCSTLGYWYPVDNWVNGEGIYENKYNIHQNPKLNLNTDRLIENIKSIKIFKYLSSIGPVFILILISIFNTYIMHDKKKLLIYIPTIGLWLTMMIASPVYAEFRYVYSAFMLLPLFIIYPYIND